MKLALRRSGVSWKPLIFMRKEMDERKDKERKR
jgi:hypothetical protein